MSKPPPATAASPSPATAVPPLSIWIPTITQASSILGRSVSGLSVFCAFYIASAAQDGMSNKFHDPNLSEPIPHPHGVRAGLCVLGLDLPRYRHRGRAHPSRADVRREVPYLRPPHAALLRAFRASHPL